MLQRVLVPFDGSAVAASIFPAVAAVVRLTGASITLLQVLPLDRVGDDEQTARDELAVAAQRFAGTGTTIETQLVRGQPAEQIIAAGRAHDLIAMATHGRSGLGRLVYGSVADQVLCRATVPVLLVRAGADAVAMLNPLRRVVVPLDGSALAEQALPLATELARRAGATVMLLTSIHWATRLFGANPGLVDPTTLDRRALTHPYVQDYLTEVADEQAHEYLDEIRQRLVEQGLTVQVAVRLEPAAEAILGCATQPAADLIVMTTHGRSGLRRWLLGSVAEQVLQRATTPVLLVRAVTIDVPTDAAEHPQPERRGASRRLTPCSGRRSAMLVKEIMTKPVITVRTDTSLEEVAQTMLTHGIGCVPVVDDAGKLVGIITEANFTGRERLLPFSMYRLPTLFNEWVPKEGIEAMYAAARTMTAGQIMTEHVFTLTEDDTVTTAVEKMIRRDVNHLPVVRDGVPVGMVARHDLLKLMMHDDQRK
jgi:nucleotide-binding universal stress UspA family protein/predicted transcriptional regulator